MTDALRKNTSFYIAVTFLIGLILSSCQKEEFPDPSTLPKGLPKIGSAPYSFKITADNISVIDGLSSAMEGGTYYFNFDEPNLTIKIGKFCKYIATKHSILTFRKIN